MQPGLYIIATPIGNIQDITIRALDILKKADYVFCEDTRKTSILLNFYSIKTRLKIYNDYSNMEDRNYIKKLIIEEKIVVLVSDSGTPLISDPGYKLINFLVKDNLYITSIPGPTSLISALVLSGIATDSFSFFGFIPSNIREAKKFLQEKSSISTSLIFFETSKRIRETLKILAELFPDRQIAIARELTKKFEQILRDNCEKLYHFSQTEEFILKGEIVIILEGNKEEIKNDQYLSSLKIMLKYTNVKTASLMISEIYDINKNDIYNQALKLIESNEQ